MISTRNKGGEKEESREGERERKIIERERERESEGGGLRRIEMLPSSGSISKYPSRDPVSRRVSGDRFYGAASRPMVARARPACVGPDRRPP